MNRVNKGGRTSDCLINKLTLSSFAPGRRLNAAFPSTKQRAPITATYLQPHFFALAVPSTSLSHRYFSIVAKLHLCLHCLPLTPRWQLLFLASRATHLSKCVPGLIQFFTRKTADSGVNLREWGWVIQLWSFEFNPWAPGSHTCWETELLKRSEMVCRERCYQLSTIKKKTKKQFADKTFKKLLESYRKPSFQPIQQIRLFFKGSSCCFLCSTSAGLAPHNTKSLLNRLSKRLPQPHLTLTASLCLCQKLFGSGYTPVALLRGYAETPPPLGWKDSLKFPVRGSFSCPGNPRSRAGSH